MDEVNKRAQRIHHRERLKNTRKNYWGRTGMSEKQLGVVVNTPKPCSCIMCGKPKKHTLAISEIREYQDRLQDYDLESTE